MNMLDSYDRAILAQLQEDAAQTYGEIGARINLSPSATLRRVQRLTEKGYILATRAILDPEKIGQSLTIIIEVSLENENVATLTAVRQSMIDDPAVLQCYYVTGETDIFAIIAVPNMKAYKSFTDFHFAGNPNIKRFKTSVVMDHVKSTTAYALSQAQ
jgi:Lrp/AsnC family transcriptional regulator, leucine-responsive regulatory protein